MEDTNRLNSSKNKSRIQLGMSSFGYSEREQFGQNIRLAMGCIAMGCIEGSSEPVKGKAIPSDEASIRQQLKALSQEITSQHADLLELLVRFDDLEGWKTGGASHCAAWMNFEIGIGIQLSWEYLRVGRKLRSLPITKALFKAGTLSWSKVRLITRVADEDNERILCHAALDAPVSDVKRLCEGYRWNETDDDESDINAENDRAIKQWNARSLTWNEDSNGSTRIQLVLPPEIAQAFLNSVEHSLNQLETTDANMSQRRADAATLMAETSLQSAGRDIATADRYQVIVSADSAEFPIAHIGIPTNKNSDNTSKNSSNGAFNIPTKRPSVKGAGPVALETAKRLSCDCSISVNRTNNGEPINIGRKSRIWPSAMERAIKERDQHCVWPGCTQSRHLQIHHIKHWADGGTTSVTNGACLCSHHHTLVHEGGYNIQRVEHDNKWLNEQFMQQLPVHQQPNNSTNPCGRTTSEIEKVLRNDRESFNNVRQLSPSRFRFRIVDAQGQNILTHAHAHAHASLTDETNQSTNQSLKPKRVQQHEYTRIQCREDVPEYYYHTTVLLQKLLALS